MMNKEFARKNKIYSPVLSRKSESYRYTSERSFQQTPSISENNGSIHQSLPKNTNDDSQALTQEYTKAPKVSTYSIKSGNSRCEETYKKDKKNAPEPKSLKSSNAEFNSKEVNSSTNWNNFQKKEKKNKPKVSEKIEFTENRDLGNVMDVKSDIRSVNIFI